MKKMILFILLIFCINAYAQSSKAYIGIIMDDMGNRASTDKEIVQLPGSVTCAILPYTYDSFWIANKAHENNKEVIAHVPMEANSGQKMGRGGLSVELSQSAFDQILINDLKAIPYVIGLNNHMGSLLTKQPKQMGWLMNVIKPTGIFFIDSRTTSHTVAETIAEQDGVPVLRRNVFLDNNPSPSAVALQFQKLIRLAHSQGMAIAIGHPYPATIHYLQKELPLLNQEGVVLVPLSQLMNDKQYVSEVREPYNNLH